MNCASSLNQHSEKPSKPTLSPVTGGFDHVVLDVAVN